MKVLIVASPWLGGSGTVGFQVAEELSKLGFETHFLSYEIPFKNTKKSRVNFHTVQGFTYPLFPFPLYELALAEKIVDVVVKEKINIIHSHYGILFAHASLIAKNILSGNGIKVKVVSTFHGSDVIGFDLTEPGKVVPKHLNSWVGNNSDSVTVASQTLKKLLIEIYGVKKKVQVVPNFLDTTTFKPTTNKKTITKPKIIHISNFRKVKQPLLVAKIFQKISKEIPDSQLTLIGDGPMKQEVLQFLNQNSLKKINDLGAIKDEKKIIKELQQSHLLLLPSIFENFPLVALEAHACGVPVVTSNTGGTPELVINGETGITCDKDDHQQMANESINLLNNSSEWMRFSENARKRVLEYDTSNIIKQYISIYQQ